MTAIENTLDNILNTGSKVRIIRLFISRREDFMASGREIARLIKLTPPAAHAALKELHSQDVLGLSIIGKQHIYRLNADSRIVKKMLDPVFKKERSIKKDIVDFLKRQIVEKKIKTKIFSLILYGSLQAGTTDDESDADIAIVVKTETGKKQIEKIFIEEIANRFYDYFGIHLDAYIVTKAEFTKRFKKKQPPVSTLMLNYFIVYGKDLIDLI